MQEWVQQILSSHQFSFAFFPAVFLLGMLGSVSSCCALPAMGAVIGYAGTRESKNSRREVFFVGLFFMLGTIVALSAIGAVSGYLGQVTGSSLGKVWQFFSGLAIVFFGLVSLNLIQIKIPEIKFGKRAAGAGMWSAMAYGLALGGSSTACTVGCNPLLPIAISAAVLNSSMIMGAITLTVFAIGYSFPLAAGLIGISFGLGKLGTVAQRILPAIRMGGGILLIFVGFYLLATI